MAGSFQNRKWFVAFSDIFKVQSAWDTAIANGDLNKRFPQLTPTAPSRQVTREETRDCSGEYVILEELTSRLFRLRFSFNPSAQMLAGMLAYGYSAAASPTGTPADEVQTLTVSATGGTFTISFDFEGLAGTTSPLAYNANAATVQAALEALRPIKTGNVACSGTLSGGMSITFQNKLGKANMPLLTTNAGSLTGGAGTATVVQTTQGANKLHAISRSTSDQPSIFSFIGGFDGDATNPRKYKNAVLNSINLTGTARGKVQAEVDLICSADLIEALSYITPACVNFVPMKVSDCRLSIDGTYYTEQLREFSFEYSNNILTGDDAFPFDDIDAIRLERGDRTSNFTFAIFGSRGDALFTLAEGETQESVRLDLGQAGDRVSIIAPSAKLKLAENELTFIGDANRSAINLEAVPFLDEAVAGTPDYIEANIAQTTAFLTT
jgi:hypothetical protein